MSFESLSSILTEGLSVSKKRHGHSAEQILKKLRDADAKLASGKSVGEVLQSLEISEATLSHWCPQYGDMKSEAANRLDKYKVSGQNCWRS